MAWEVFGENIGFATANYNGTMPTQAQLDNENYTYTVFNQYSQRPTRGEYPFYTGNIGAVYNVPIYNQYAIDSRQYGLLLWDNNTGLNVGYLYNGNFDSKYLGFFINHETKKARVFTCGVTQRYNQSAYAVPSTQGKISASTIYQILMGAIIPEFNLHSLDNVVGIDATLWLSSIKDEYTNAGDPVLDVPIDYMRTRDPRAMIKDLQPATGDRLVATTKKTDTEKTELFISQNTNGEYYIIGKTTDLISGSVIAQVNNYIGLGLDEEFLGILVDYELERATTTTINITTSTKRISYNYEETKPFLNNETLSHIFYTMLNLEAEPDEDDDDPYDDNPKNPHGGGGGDREYTSDDNDNTPLPASIACNLGFITLFSPTETQLRQLASYMWTDSLFDLDNFKKIFADPMDCILSLMKYPVTITTSGSKAVTVGNISTNVNMYTVSNEFVEESKGYAKIAQQLNAFLDYSPHTQLEVYLPFCGRHHLNVDLYVQRKFIAISYRINVLTGGCVATLYDRETGDVLDQFSGNCAYSIPITSTNYQNAINSLVQAGAGLASGYVGGIMGINPKATITAHVGNTGNAGASSSLQPYFIFTCPKLVTPESANAIQGQPAYTTHKISALTGFVKVHSIDLTSAKATIDELNEIETILKGGAYV